MKKENKSIYGVKDIINNQILGKVEDDSIKPKGLIDEVKRKSSAPKNPVGVFSAREIRAIRFVTGSMGSKEQEEIKSRELFLNTKYLNFDLFLWRCEQYKKYEDDIGIFEDDYPKFIETLLQAIEGYKSQDDKFDRYNHWLFDFVMNGNMDKEFKEEKIK